MKFLFDECLSPTLVRLALNAGHLGTTCVRDRGWQGLKDWQLMQIVIAEDFTLITHNAKDFRGKANNSGKGLHARQSLHAGLVCLNSFEPLDLNRQEKLLRIAFDELAQLSDLVNQALEITENDDGSIDIDRYEIASLK
ncbi:putative nuclease of putative toxin-antitoxin system [Oxalobacteraceae bacterium GrIS 2.11]